MRYLTRVAAAAALLALAGCGLQQGVIESQEHMLSAAGFGIHPATSAEQQRQMASLPPHHVVWRQQDGKLVFLFADPLVCHCVFAGDERAYQTYRRMVIEKHEAEAICVRSGR